MYWRRRAGFNAIMLSSLIINVNASDFIILYMWAFSYIFQPPVVIVKALKYVKLKLQ
jgi:hypothetical protein